MKPSSLFVVSILLILVLSIGCVQSLDAQRYYQMGIENEKTNDSVAALGYYSQAIEANPQFAAAYNNRGALIANSPSSIGNLTALMSAQSDFDKAIQIDPSNAVLYRNRGQVKNKMNKTADAILDYDKAISLKPDYSAAFFQRGWTKQRQGDFKGALADYDAAINIEKDPISRAVVLNARGGVKYLLGDIEGAKADISESQRLEPTMPSYEQIVKSMDNRDWLVTNH